MGIRLEDIPKDPINLDEVSALADKTFDYADREQVSMREARRVISQQTRDETARRAMIESNKVFGTNFDTTNPNWVAGTIDVGYGDFTFREKSLETAKALHRGLGGLVKLPGIALKAVGEAHLTRSDVEKLKNSSSEVDRQFGAQGDNETGRATRRMANFLAESGNKYINKVNGMMFEESQESQGVRERGFSENPIFRTSAAVAESMPTYGTAVAATLTTGNPNIGLYIMGTTTAASSYENLRNQGVDPDLALIGATIEGSIEMLTEKVPMDILMKGTGRKFLERALKLGTAESFQELFANLGQNYTSAVVKDVDPENYATALAAAKQEWNVISSGWQDSMAAGFFMGGGAAVFSGGPDSDSFGFRTEKQMREQYGVLPRNTGELLYLTEQIRKQVKAVGEGDTAPVEGETKRERISTSDLVETPVSEAGDAVGEVDAKTSPRTSEDIGEGEVKVRGTSKSVLAQAIEDDMVDGDKDIEGQLPVYRVMNATEQAQKVADLILDDIEQAKRIAFYQEDAPPGLYAEKVFSGLRTYGRESGDVDLVYELMLNEDAAREHTVLGKKVQSLDTGENATDPVQAGREVIDARKEKIERDGGDLRNLEQNLTALQDELDITKKKLSEHTKKARKKYGTKNKVVSRTEYDEIMARREQEISELRHGRNLGAAYVPNAQDFIDLAKISAFHIEAIGRDFATWSARVTRDMGEWVTPHLAGEFEKATKEVGENIPTAKEVSPEARRASALKAYKTKLKNQIKQLSRQIESGIKEAKGGKKLTLDAEAKQLKTERDSLKVIFDKVFGKKKASIESRIATATKVVEKSIATLEEKIKKGDTSTKKRQKPVSTPKLDALRKRRADLQKDLQKLRNAEKPKKSPEQARLDAKKSRLKSGTKKIDAKLEALDFDKTERRVIELDAEGQKLQDAYDIAKERYRAAQGASNIITQEEVQIITDLSQKVSDSKQAMENSRRRNNLEDEAPTIEEMAYGNALYMFNTYVGSLKFDANKKTIKQNALDYLNNPFSVVSDIFGIIKNLKATWDNSFIGRQGRKTFLKGLTGDIKSAKIWWSTFFKSFKVIWGTVRGRDVKQALYAEIVSDPDYALLLKSKVAINVNIEEEQATDLLEKIPLFGIVFEASDNAFGESARYMRYKLAKNYMNIWRRSGKELNEKQLFSLGRLANSQTGRGEGASTGLLNNVFWSPGNLRASIDVLTLHLLDKNFSAYARKQAAMNLLRYVSGAAAILALSDWIDDDSVTWDSNSSDFGKIVVGNTRFSVGGGLEILVVLASRLVTREFTSATTGKTRDIDEGSFFQDGGKELVYNFFENKFSPGIAFTMQMIDQATREGDSLSVPQMAKDGLSPLIIQNVMESGNSDDAANILLVLIAEALGVNVQTFTDKKKKTNIPSIF